MMKKKKIELFSPGTTKCSCGSVFYFESSTEKMHIEICSQCHPFYTGKKKIVDTMGRVERFQKRASVVKKANEISK